MELDNCQPQLRFPPYTDPWIKIKLSDLADIYQPATISSMDCHSDGVYPVFGANGIIGRFDKMNHETDQVCVSCRGANCGKVNYVTGNSMVCNVDTNAIVDKTFFYYALCCVDYLPVITGGAQPQITRDKLQKVVISIPDVNEQKEIGEFLFQLDKLISLNQSKCDAILKYRNGLLQHMFPQSDETIPRIRFPGFTEPWKQRKLGELYIERKEKGNDSLQILSVSIHSGVSDGELDEEKLGKTVRRSEDKSTYKHVYSGDLVFNMMRAWQGAIGVVKSEGMISPAYISAIPNNEVYPLFMDYALRRKEAIAQINDLSYGVTDFRKRLYWDSFIDVKCMLPAVEEQKAIWWFFKAIDDTISLYKRKCDELKMYKRGLLQKMLV